MNPEEETNKEEGVEVEVEVVRTWEWFFRHDLRSSVRRSRAIPDMVSLSLSLSLCFSSESRTSLAPSQLSGSEFNEQHLRSYLFPLSLCVVLMIWGCGGAKEAASILSNAASIETYGPDSIFDSRDCSSLKTSIDGDDDNKGKRVGSVSNSSSSAVVIEVGSEDEEEGHEREGSRTTMMKKRSSKIFGFSVTFPHCFPFLSVKHKTLGCPKENDE